MTDPVNQLMTSAAGKAAQATIGKMGGGFIGDILQYSEWGINQRLRLLENQIKAVTRLKEVCDRTKWDIRQVNLKALLPYLEGVAVEEEPELQKLWTDLMVNYIDPEKVMSTHV